MEGKGALNLRMETTISTSLECFHVIPVGEGISEGVLHKLRAKSRALYEHGGTRTIITGPSGCPVPLLQEYEDWIPYSNNYVETLEYLAKKWPRATFFLQYQPVNRSLLNFLTRNPQRVVFEHNTINPLELKFRCKDLGWRDIFYILRTDPRRLFTEYLGPYFNELLYGSRAVGFSRASVCVCRTVEEYILRNHPQHPTLVLGNGIDSEDITMRTSFPALGSTVRMIFICGSPSNWTGADRLVQSLSKYEGQTIFELHCVGRFAPKVRRIAQGVAKPHSVHFHGVKSRPEILEMTSKMHLGVGSLGQHRYSMWDASTLKVREYMAMGLPFLMGYQDIDTPSDYRYSYVYPSDESLLDLNQLPRFLERLYGEGFLPSKMRANSLPLIEMRDKAARLIEFLGTL